jgi:hypothetical protein
LEQLTPNKNPVYEIRNAHNRAHSSRGQITITIKKQKDYVMTKSTPTLTLTQIGLLAVLLQRQRYAVIQLARRSAHHQHLRAAFWKTLTLPFRTLKPRTLVGYTGSRQQLHGDLRIQHPEWVEPNGESSMRLLKVLDSLT